MAAFYWTLFSTYLVGLVSRINRSSKKPLFIGTFLVALIFIVISGCRSGIGDTTMYTHLYEMIIENTYKDGYEKGFIFFLNFLATISQDPQFMIIVTSVITHGINIFVMANYSSYFELEVYMYIASGFFLTSMNGIRQAMATAIVFLGTVFLVKRKFIPYTFLVLIASTLHTSAIIMIPVYFIVNNDLWAKHFNVIVMAGIFIIVFGGVISSILFRILASTRYGSYDTFEEGGANIIRAAVAFVPVLFAYLQKYNLKKSEVCIVGDQIFTDVFGGNKVGIKTCLVEPLNDTELKFTRFMRKLEKKTLNYYSKRGKFTKGDYYD